MAGKHLSVPIQIGKQGLWEEFKEYEKQTELEGEQYAYSKKKRTKYKIQRGQKEMSILLQVGEWLYLRPSVRVGVVDSRESNQVNYCPKP